MHRETALLNRPDFATVLEASLRGAWDLDAVFPAGAQLDFSRDFLPESLARTRQLGSLSAVEQRQLNQIAAHQYCGLFVIVERFILPFLLDHVREAVYGENVRLRALLNFAAEEAKHTHLFQRFRDAFERNFPTECELIGPAEAIGGKVLSHHPLAVGFAILMFEWMSQTHYLDSIRDAPDIDPLFKSMFRHHWIEEAQHARLDVLLIDAIAEKYDDAERERAFDDFEAIVDFLDSGLRQQAKLNVQALERASAGQLVDTDELVKQQHQAARYTYLASGMDHRSFRRLLDETIPAAATRLAALSATLQ